jgi:prophage regulatory protein
MKAGIRKSDRSPVKLLVFKELKSVKGIPYTCDHLLRLEKAGMFPKRIRLGQWKRSRVAWLDSEIDDYIRRLMGERALLKKAKPSRP